jgi:hypothetical protein
MGPLKRGADFGDGLIEIFVQPRDLLLPRNFSARVAGSVPVAAANW